MKMKNFFAIPVEVSEHATLNSSKGIIRDRTTKQETEENIRDFLQDQGVTHVKRLTIRRNNEIVPTNTLLLTFNTVEPPKSVKIFYQIIPVEMYFPNSLRCFNSQRFGLHESNCPAEQGSVCERCGTGNNDHQAHQCKQPAKCVNCNGNHMSRSSECEVWKKEKEIMKLKVANRLTYPDARKLYEQQRPEFTLKFAKVVQSMTAKPETKTASTQYHENDFNITESSKVIIAREPKSSTNSQNSQRLTASQKKANSTDQQSKTKTTCCIGQSKERI